MKTRDGMQIELRDGELLLCVGGQLDGRYRTVTVLNWWRDGVPSAGFKLDDGSEYRRDGRRWVYVEGKE